MNYILKVNANQLIKAHVLGVYILIYKSMHNILRGKATEQHMWHDFIYIKGSI